MQVAVLGDAGCGKTSLIRSLVGLEFDLESPPTERKTSYRTSLDVNSEDYVTIVDCGPIEDEAALGKLLRGVSCVLIAFDCTNHQSFESIQAVWFDAVKRTCWDPEIMILVVSCKSDLFPREVSVEEIEAFASQKNIFFLEVSAKFGTSIDVLLNVIRARMPQRRSNIPQMEHSVIYNSPQRSAASHYSSPYNGFAARKAVNLNQSEQPTMLRIHRTGSVDLSSQVSGVNFHVSRDGSFVNTDPSMVMLLGDNTHVDDDDEADVEAFPLMVDVKMAGGNVGTIMVNSLNDDPLFLAEQFIRQHGLDSRRAPELARVVKARLDEYFSPSLKSKDASFMMRGTVVPPFNAVPASPNFRIPAQSTPITMQSTSSMPSVASASFSIPPPQVTQQPQLPRPILARLNVGVGNGSAVVAVREGDDANKVVDAFRRTYGLLRGDPILNDLTRQINDVLQRGVSTNDATQASSEFGVASGRTSLSDTQRKLLYKTLGMDPPMRADATVPLGGAVQISSPSRVVEVKVEAESQPPVSKQEEVAVEEEEKILEEVETEQPKPAVEATTPKPGPPPPPPPSKYAQKPSPVPYRTPQTPGTAKAASSPATARSTNSPATARSTGSPATRNVTPSTGARSASSSSSKRIGRPLVYVDVNMGGKSDRIAVHKGDNLTEVAEQFLEANNISKTKTLKLTQLLEYHLRLHQKNRRQG